MSKLLFEKNEGEKKSMIKKFTMALIYVMALVITTINVEKVENLNAATVGLITRNFLNGSIVIQRNFKEMTWYLQSVS